MVVIHLPCPFLLFFQTSPALQANNEGNHNAEQVPLLEDIAEREDR